MLTKEQFTSMMQAAEMLDAEIDRWSEFGIDLFETPLAEISWDIFHNWTNIHFNSDGIDWINWYLWERRSINTGEVLACYNEDGSEFYIETLEDLWKVVKDCMLTPCLYTTCPSKSDSCTN